jgi:DNA-binding Xre family transcriptional regulator
MKSRLRLLMAEKAFNEDRRISLRVMAKETGIPMYTLQGMSKGDIHSLSLETMDTLARYFNCGLDDLFQRDVDDNRGNDSPALVAA